MKKKFIVAAGMVAMLVGSAAGAGAFEGPWIETIEGLDRQAQVHEEEAREVQARARALDELLQGRVADADTAERATRSLRREVGTQLVLWEQARRRMPTQELVGGRDARIVKRALQESRKEASGGEWEEKVRLLSTVAEGVEEAGILFLRRTQMEVERAELLGRAEKTRAERQWVLQLVAEGQGGARLSEELAERAEGLDQKVGELDRHETGEDFHRRKGALIPPVGGSIAHGFGPRKQAGSMSFVRHTGLTYLVESGTEVRSVAPGRVVFADRLDGYGRLLIVDHGGGYHSLYAHLSEFGVATGQQIRGREVVGRSGESGSLEGPKLYFELRQQGVPVNPQEWFVRHE